MKLIIATLLFFVSNIALSQQSELWQEFPLDKMILGEWYLVKTEFITYNNSDTTIIYSNENKTDKLTFENKLVKTQHNLYSSGKINREFPYKIDYDTLTNYHNVNLYDFKKKRIIEQNKIILLDFEQFIFERYTLTVGLGDAIILTKFYYVRNPNKKITNPILNKWYFNPNNSLFDATIHDTTTYKLIDSKKENIVNNKGVYCYLELRTNNTFNYFYGGEFSGVFSTRFYIIDLQNQIIYFKNDQLIAFNYELIDGSTLKLTVNQKVTKKLIK